MSTGLRDLIAPVRGRLAVAATLAGIASLCSLVPLIAVTILVRDLLDSGRLAPGLWAWVFAGVAGGVARVLLNAAATSMSHYADADFRASVRSRVAGHLADLPLGWFSVRGSGAVKKAKRGRANW